MKQTIKIAGFSNQISSPDSNHLVISAFGPEGTGKTQLITSAPGPIGVVALDRKSRFTIEKRMKELGRTDIFMPPDDFVRHAKPIELSLMKPDKVSAYYSDHIKAVQEACYKLLEHPDVRTVALDGGSQMWEDVLFKHYGRNQRIMPRDRGPANQDMIDFLNAMTGKHFIITHKMKQIWENDKPVPGKFEPSCFNGIGHHVTVVVQMMRNDRYNPQANGEQYEWMFGMKVKHCQAEAMLQVEGNDGNFLKDEEISFQTLAAYVYPDADQTQFMMEQD